jgi:hypothetical protein
VSLSSIFVDWVDESTPATNPISLDTPHARIDLLTNINVKF